MIWHDAIRSSACDSSGSTDEPLHRVDCHAISDAGQRFEWQIESADGLTGVFRIDGERYNLSDGAIFIVKTADGTTDIRQIQGDLSDVCPEIDSITAYGLSHEDIEQFIQSAVSK
jgi:hypothetical protein